MAQRFPDVLVVDDNSALAESICAYLEAHGLRAETFTDPVQAVSRLANVPVRVVLASMRLPGGGPEFVDWARERTAGNTAFLLMTSTRPTPSELKHAHDAGAAGIVQKMSGPRAIEERVRAVMREAAPGTRPGKAAPLPRGPSRGVRQGNENLVRAAIAGLKRREPGDAGPRRRDFLDDPDLYGEEGFEDDRPSQRGSLPFLSEAEEAFQRGLRHFDRQEIDPALNRFSKAWSLDASEPRYLAYRARCLHLKSRGDVSADGDLADDLRMVVMLKPDLPEGHLFLGLLLADAGRTEEARGCLKKVLQLSPGDKEAAKALRRLR